AGIAHAGGSARAHRARDQRHSRFHRRRGGAQRAPPAHQARGRHPALPAPAGPSPVGEAAAAARRARRTARWRARLGTRAALGSMRRHHIWMLVGLLLMLAAWFAWSTLTVESDLAR